MALGLAREALDTPDNRLLFGFVLGTTEGVLDLGLGGIFGNRYLDHHVGRKELVRESGNYLEVDGKSKKQNRQRKNGLDPSTKGVFINTFQTNKNTHFVKLCSS